MSEVNKRRSFLILRGIAALCVLGLAGALTDIAAMTYTFVDVADATFNDLKNKLLTSVVIFHIIVSLVVGFVFLSVKYFTKLWPFERAILHFGGNKIDEIRIDYDIDFQEDERKRAIPDPRDRLKNYAAEAGKLARRILERSELYLYVGIVIAFIGIIGFYFRVNAQNALVIDKGALGSSILSVAVNYLPSAVFLFFIELLAFFFLRLFRSSMDEFRYYDSVRRNREENLVILEMFAENDEIVSPSDVLKSMKIYSSPSNLASGETTEILETRRLQRDEWLIFEKIVDAFEYIKKSEKAVDKEKRKENQKE